MQPRKKPANISTYQPQPRSRPTSAPPHSPHSSQAANMAGLFGSASSAANANPTQGDLSKDVAVSDPPEDSISDIAFSPQSDHLAVASWDKKVRIYEIDGNGNSQGRAFFEFEGPVLNCAWSKVRAHDMLLQKARGRGC